MGWLFLQSLRLHFVWWARSLLPGCHRGAPLGARRVLFLVLLYPLLLLLLGLHWIALALDEVLFPRYRTTPVQAPVFVSGIPRSGTTFVHRTLASDPRFTTVSSWEALLAPSITQRKVLRCLAALDAAIGRPVSRSLHALVRRRTGTFNEVHEVDPAAPEEDYLCLLPAGGCFLLLFAFPFATALLDLGRFEKIPARRRSLLLAFYHRIIQRHLYCAPDKARFLSKNAAFATWVPSLLKTFPDARFLLCVRQPLAAISSQLSSLRPARKIFGTDPDGSLTAALMTGVLAEAYSTLAALAAREDAEDQLAFIDQDDLRQWPDRLLLRAVRRLQLDSPELVATLGQLVPPPPSPHRHRAGEYPLDLDQIRVCHDSAYQAILSSQGRVTCEAPSA